MSATSPTAPAVPPSADPLGGPVGPDQTLSGYRHQDFPDLSARRFAPDSLRSISQSFDPVEQNKDAFFAAVVTATARVLGAYCNCQDVLLAIPDGEEESTSVLAVRVTWGPATTWGDAVAAITRATADHRLARIHPGVLRRALDLTPKQSPALALVSARTLLHPALGPHFPIFLVADQENAVLSITASERVVHPSQSTLLLSQVVALARHATSAPTSSMAVLPQLPAALLSFCDRQSLEKRLSVHQLVPLPKFATDYLTLRAVEQPDAIAVRWYADLSTDVPISSYAPETMTNAELERKANQLGRWLLNNGLQKGRSVAICMQRDIWFHIAFIGVLRAGGCYVPIDTELPTERQQFIAKDSDAQFILSASDLPCFSTLGSIAIDLKDPAVQQAIEEQSAQTLMIPDPDDLSYILYTSGTTGKPKGCILTHRGLTEAIWALSLICAGATPAPSERLHYLSLASVAFDVHICEIMVSLAVGMTILSAPRSLLLEDLSYYITHLRVSHVGLVPSLIEATMGAMQEDEDLGHESTLRYISCGGEKMSDAILDKWASHHKVRLANFYGPSEVTIGCAGRIMDKDTPRANIGPTFPNVAAYVVDENMKILLRGGTGELVVEGPLVGCGYVGRPDLTQKVFLKFPDDGTERWAYRTGDLVRMMADGTLEITGRIDTQIKLRGVRIESEGISSIIRNAAAPAHTLDVLTILAKHPAIGVDQLVSFIAWDPSVSIGTRKGGTPSPAVPPEGLLHLLRGACDRELASYMRPSHIVPLSFIPLNSNGKADAKVLSTLFLGLDLDALTGLMPGDSFISAPQDARVALTEVERRVVEVLGVHVKVPVDRVGPSTNLFECGMDSLAITRFAADIRRAFYVTVSPARIMQSPVVSGIAAMLDNDRSASSREKVAPSIPASITLGEEETAAAYSPDAVASVLPPFPVQEGVLYRSANSPTMYVQHVLMRLASHASVTAFGDAWSQVVGQHEMLRTVFHFGSNLAQVVLRPESCVAQVLEKKIPDLDDVGFQRHFTEQEASCIARELNVDISKVPPVRLSFFVPSSASRVYAVLSIHHALYDGVSLPVLLQDLERMYARQPQLPSASLQEMLEHVTLIDQDGARTFWTSYLKDYPWKRLLNRSASSAVADEVSVPFKLSLSDLQDKAAKQQVTLQALLMGAYGSLVAQYIYGHDDVMFGVIRTGRTIPVDHVETTICPMITVVPARVRLSEPSKVLQTVQQDNARVSEYEHVPLSRIQKWVLESDQCLFDTLFSITFKEDVASKLWTVLESQNPEPDYILAVEVVLDPDQDAAIVRAVYTSSDVSTTLVLDILNRLEETAVRMAETSDWSLSLSRGTLAAAAQTETTDADVGSLADVDQDLVARICTAASHFLRVNPDFVKAETSLLSLGLDSIKAVGLSRKLSSEGLRLSSADIMRLSTPLRLAAFVQRSTASKPGEDRLSDASFSAECVKIVEGLDLVSVKLSEADNVRVYPTTVLQAGMLSQTISSRGRLYVHLFPLRLSPDVDVDRLRGAWEKAIASFDMLRTTFHFLPSLGAWSQVVHSHAPIQWTELQHDAEANLTESLNPLLDLSDERDFFRQPPVILYLLKATSPNDAHRLVLVLHHALYDGLAIARLFHAVEQLYHGSDLPVDTQYQELLPRLLWQENHGTSFWISRLRNLRHAPLLRKPASSTETSVHQVSLPVRLAQEEIQQACRYAEVTPQCVGQAAFVKLLAVMTRSRDVVFGRVVSGRDLPGADAVIGPMLNTVPCRVVLQEGVANKALLKHIQDANIACMPWQHASLRSIQRALHIPNLWDSLFVFQPRQESLESTSGSPWVFDGGDVEEIFVHYPLNVELHETEGGFVVKAACTSDIADSPGLRELVEQYVAILYAIIRRPDDLWSTDMPEVSLEMSPPKNDVVSEGAQDDPQAWDSHLDSFRDVLSAAAKVPSSKILAGTHLAALGIDSIAAVQIVAKARRLRLRLTAADIAQSRTVGDLLRKIKVVGSSTVNGVVKPASTDVPRARWSSILPPQVHGLVERVTNTSPGMEWMIGMWQRSRGSRFQHVFGYRIAADVESARLQDAWNKLVRRHPILRSTFTYDAELGVPLVVVFNAEALSSSWTQETLSPSSDPLSEVQQRMEALVSHPPPVDRPITRAVFLQSPQERYLVIHLHHFQYDAWSLPLLVDDLLRIYADEQPNSSNDLDSFLHSVTLRPETEQEQAKYWRAAFADSEPPALFPCLSDKPAPRPRSVYTDHAAISGALELDKRARDLAISLQSVFLASWAQVHGKHAASDNIAFSLWHSGRTGDLKDIELLVAPCINVLPFHVSGARGDDTIVLARQIQDSLQARSTVVEQSRLMKVHEWAGARGSPLTNVFVNIVKTAPDLEKTSRSLIESLELPYYIPEASPDTVIGDTMRVTDFIQDDIMIDIIVNHATDQVLMSIEFAGSILDTDGAQLVLGEWATAVRTALEVKQ